MKKNLNARLTQLEEGHRNRSQYQDFAAKAAADAARTAATVARWREELRKRGFEQSLTESFAELLCRAFGLTGAELKAELAAHASGRYRE